MFPASKSHHGNHKLLITSLVGQIDRPIANTTIFIFEVTRLSYRVGQVPDGNPKDLDLKFGDMRSCEHSARLLSSQACVSFRVRSKVCGTYMWHQLNLVIDPQMSAVTDVLNSCFRGGVHRSRFSCILSHNSAKKLNFTSDAKPVGDLRFPVQLIHIFIIEH